MGKIKIVSDGTPNRTRIYDINTGEIIEGARRIEYRIDVNSIAVATIEFVCVECEIESEACLKHKELLDDEELEKLRSRKNKKYIIDASELGMNFKRSIILE